MRSPVAVNRPHLCYREDRTDRENSRLDSWLDSWLDSAIRD